MDLPKWFPFGRASVPADDPLLEMSPSRHPFQILCMLACMFGGMGNLLTQGSPAINKSLPVAIAVVWAVTMFIAGFMALVGAYSRDRATGLLLERTAMWGIGISCLSYGVLITLVSGQASVATAPLVIFTGVAAFVRKRQVSRELRTLQSFMHRQSAVAEVDERPNREG